MTPTDQPLDPDPSQPTARLAAEENSPASEDALAPANTSILHLIEEPEATLNQAPASRALPPRLPELPGYEMLSVLGYGGMGAVFKARQQKLDRVVAVKMISNSNLFREEVGQRFETEAHAIAQIRHPNVVQIHDVGWHNEVPYLVLEYVEGGSLDRYLRSKPQPPKSVAEMLLAIARGVEAAHAKGIIHRDLKPGNILVERRTDGAEAKPVTNASGPLLPLGAELIPKITDFGLAKQVASMPGPTLPNEAIGTPNYMAPEQARGEHQRVSPATDVYALGSIMYEMLTGRPPFQGIHPIDTLKLVIESEPVPPRRFVPLIPLDLETICLKCLRKEPEQRYPSARALAEDLERFIDGRSILARPQSTWEKAWRLCCRHPVPAGLTAALLLSLLAGVWLVGMQYQRAERHLAEAHAKFQMAREAVDKLLLTVGDQLHDSADIPKVREEVLLEALTFYQRFLAERSDDPVIRRQAAAAYLRVADIELLLGRMTAAGTSFQESLRLMTELVEDQPMDLAVQYDLANAHKRHGIYFAQQGQYGPSEAAYRRALAMVESLHDKEPRNPAFLRLLGDCLNNLGNRLVARHAFTDAEAIFERAVQAREALVELDPRNVEFRMLQSSVNHNLAALEIKRGKYAQAQERLQRNIGQQEQFMNDLRPTPIYRRNLAEAYRELGFALLFRQQFDEAQAALRKCLHCREELANDYPSVPIYSREAALANLELAEVCEGQRKFAEVPGWLEAANRHFQRIVQAGSGTPSDRTQALLVAAYARLLENPKSHDPTLVETCMKPPPPDGETYLLAARLLVRASRHQAAADRVRSLDLAVALLRESRSKSYFRGAWLRQDMTWRPDFAELHQRPDFQKLLEEVDDDWNRAIDPEEEISTPDPQPRRDPS